MEHRNLEENAKSEDVIRKKDIIVPMDRFDALKHGHDRYNQVYSIDSSYLSEFIKSEIGSSSRLVIKIHDPWYYPSDDFLVYDEVYKIKSTKSNLQKAGCM